MAADVPAKDVLCEAMEYLSKLGSNLRTRSENLKEKRIRREKLNNVLAVQKAATKVLLICELSKKSLENVETGVRKVLKLVDTSQASSSNGGKISQTEKHVRNETKYYFFEYNSRKLRIKNRISFKHYNSVKVHAKMLPKSMMDQYPVHYDCKLYRKRRKENDWQEVNEEPKEKNQRSVQNDESIIIIPDTPISKPKTVNNESKSDKDLSNDVSIISIPDSPEPKMDECNKKIGKSSTDKESSRKSSVESNKERSLSRDSDRSPRKKSHKSERDRSREKDHSEKNKRLDNNDDQKKLSKRKRIISDSSSGDEKKTEVDRKDDVIASKEDDNDVSCNYSDSKKQKHNEESNDDLKSMVDKNIVIDSDKNDDTVKPVIKCVSLSKLLKPDVLHKGKVGPHSKPKHSSKANQTEEAQQIKISEKLARQEEENVEYQTKKRKEVSTFIPKNFVINVTRLPEFSIDYLNKLHLRKITRGDITICEIPNEYLDEVDAEKKNDKDETRTVKSKKRNEKRKGSDDLNSNSRRASLNSCNDHDDALIAEANKVKNSLLNESDSDCMISSDNELSSKKHTQNIKTALLNDSDSETKKSELLSKEDTENIKSALLNDSDSETKKSDDGSKSGDQDKIDKSDKESTSETEQAKHALCNESDKNEPESSTVQVEENIVKSNKSLRLTFESEQTKTGTLPAKKISDNCHSEKDNGDDKNANKNDSDGPGKKTDENSSEGKKNETTPEKGDTDKAKSSLLNDSSDEKTKTPLSQRLTPQAKKKRMRESIDAKKMLLTYSSSDTEDEKLNNVLKEIKDSLLHGSDDEDKDQKQLKESSASSGDDILKKVKKKMTFDDSSPSKRKRPKHTWKKHRRRLDSDNSSKNSDNSKASSSKVRSKK